MKSISSLLLLFVLVNCLSNIYCFYTPDSGVLQLNKKNFVNNIISTEHVSLVEFYAPWCGHCKSLKPEYEKTAKNLAGIAKVAAVNCDEEKELCGAFGVQGFPTIKIFPSKATPVKNSKKGEMEKVPTDYQGARSASAMVKAITDVLPSFATRVQEGDIEKFVSGSTENKALLLTSKDKTSNLYKALSIDFHNTLALGELAKPSQAVKDKFKIEELPALLVFKNGDISDFTLYKGKLEHAKLFSFLKPFQKLSGGAGDSKPSGEPEKETEQQVVYDSAVEIKDQASFDKICETGICAVVLFDMQSEDDKLSNEAKIELYNTLAKEYAGRIKIVYMDGSSLGLNFITELDLAGLPNMVALNASKQRYAPYLGSFSQESLKEFFNDILNGKKRTIALKSVPKLKLATKSSRDEL